MRQAIASPSGGTSASLDVASQEPGPRPWAAQQEGAVRWCPARFIVKTMERPAFTRLLRHVRAGEVRQIAVWRLDRLGGSAEVTDRPVR